MWERIEADGLTLLRCRPLLEAEGLAHAFGTRVGPGPDPVDFGGADDERPATREARERFLRAAGIEGRRPSLLRQVHGTAIVRAARHGPPPDADASYWVPGAGVPAIRTADCVPILLADRYGRAAAALHAGWRGTVGRIAAVGVASLGALGVEPTAILAALGPAIGPCCYEVGEEVAEAVARAAAGAPGAVVRSGPGRPRADLRRANRAQLLGAGVPEGAVHVAPWCTRCEPGLFHSFRRDGDRAGRMLASIGPARRVGRQP